MKKLMMIAAFLIFQIGSAQVTKNVGDFDEISVFDRISVELVASNESRVEIKGDRSSEVEVVNNNGLLKIRMKLEQLLSGEEITATVYYKELKSIAAGEGSSVAADSKFKQSSIEINAKEGANVNLDIDVTKATVRAVTGGTVTLTGSASNQDVTIGTGGIVNAKNLKTSQTSVKINAGGEAEVNASELVDARVNAGGNVTVYGNPRTVNEKTSLGGTVVIAKK